jgi:pantothenate kinase-related protein Tda10
MKLRFRNLGVIEEAVVDVTKPFIIFTGPNGTGKTYLSYVLSDLPREMGGFLLALIQNDKNKAL